jgi:hypothetical protein
MAKGQDLSRHQRGIVNRYYEHRDTIMSQKLSELVSDLYLAEGKKAESLWKRVETALNNTGADPKRWAPVVRERDLAGLAALVNELSGPAKKK